MLVPMCIHFALLCLKIIVCNDNNSGSEQSGSIFQTATCPEVTLRKKPPCMCVLTKVAVCMFITSVLCVPNEHMPLLLIIHLSSNVILDLVIISEFLYLQKTLNFINIKMPYYLHADCFFYGHRNYAIITRTIN